jgi:hypothetical protein
MLSVYVVLGCFFAALLHASGWNSTTRDQSGRYTGCGLYGLFWIITVPISILVLFTWWMSIKLKRYVEAFEKNSDSSA